MSPHSVASTQSVKGEERLLNKEAEHSVAEPYDCPSTTRWPGKKVSQQHKRWTPVIDQETYMYT